MVSERVIVSVKAECADGHSHVLVQLAAQLVEVAVIKLKRDLVVHCSAELLQCCLDSGELIIVGGVGDEFCLDRVGQQSVDREVWARSILVLL